MTKISGFSATELAVYFTDFENRLAKLHIYKKSSTTIFEFDFRWPAKDDRIKSANRNSIKMRETFLCVRQEWPASKI